MYRDEVSKVPKISFTRSNGEKGEQKKLLWIELLTLAYNCSLANTEMYLAVAAVFRRFELETFETDRQRDVDSSRDCLTGEASSKSKGVRIVVLKEIIE